MFDPRGLARAGAASSSAERSVHPSHSPWEEQRAREKFPLSAPVLVPQDRRSVHLGQMAATSRLQIDSCAKLPGHNLFRVIVPSGLPSSKRVGWNLSIIGCSQSTRNSCRTGQSCGWPSIRCLHAHAGRWPGNDSPEKQRGPGASRCEHRK